MYQRNNPVRRIKCKENSTELTLLCNTQSANNLNFFSIYFLSKAKTFLQPSCEIQIMTSTSSNKHKLPHSCGDFCHSFLTQ